MVTQDHWAIKPSVATIAAAVIWALLCGIPGILSLILLPVTLLVFPAIALVLLIAAAASAVKKRPRKAASFVLALILPILLSWPIIWVSNCLHLALSVGLGMGQIGAPYRQGDGKFASYDWSVGLVTNPDVFLVYDATDAVAKPNQKDNPARGGEDSLAERCKGHSQRLISHYFICTIE